MKVLKTNILFQWCMLQEAPGTLMLLLGSPRMEVIICKERSLGSYLGVDAGKSDNCLVQWVLCNTDPPDIYKQFILPSVVDWLGKVSYMQQCPRKDLQQSVWRCCFSAECAALYTVYLLQTILEVLNILRHIQKSCSTRDYFRDWIRLLLSSGTWGLVSF